LYADISFQFPFWLARLFSILDYGLWPAEREKEGGWSLDVAGHQSLMLTARHSKPANTHTHTHNPRAGPHLPPLNNRAGREFHGQNGDEGAKTKTTKTMTSFHGRSIRPVSRRYCHYLVNLLRQPACELACKESPFGRTVATHRMETWRTTILKIIKLW